MFNLVYIAFVSHIYPPNFVERLIVLKTKSLEDPNYSLVYKPMSESAQADTLADGQFSAYYFTEFSK